MIVDASAMIEMLLRTPKAESIKMHLRSARDEIDAPHLLDIEVAHVLRRLVLSARIDASNAARALKAQAEFPLNRHSHASLLARVWLWRHNLSAYDAVYVALAGSLETPLLTCDARLGQAAASLIEIKLV